MKIKSMDSSVGKDISAGRELDAIILKHLDWRGTKLSMLRAVITKSDPGITEQVKWKKPSNPDGDPVWSHDGIVCIGNFLKNAVRLTFPKGAGIMDKWNLFNCRLDSRTIRAIDFREDDSINTEGLKSIILQAVELNMLKAMK